MAILATVLSVVAMLIAATSFTAAFIFWGLCKRREDTWSNEVPIEREDRWKLESKRMRYALISIIGYGVSMALAMILRHALEVSQSFNMSLIGLATAGLLIVALRAMIHNGRSFEASLNRGSPNRPPF
jgi:hypothetical protein